MEVVAGLEDASLVLPLGEVVETYLLSQDMLESVRVVTEQRADAGVS